MAKKTVRVSDVSGEEIPDGKGSYCADHVCRRTQGLS